MKAVRAYRWLYIICVFIGPYMTVAAVWNIADIFNALMAIPNLIALLALSKVIVKETKAFTEKLNVEEKNQRILKGMNAENCIIEYKFCRAYGDKIQEFWYKKQNPCIYFCPLILIEKTMLDAEFIKGHTFL